MKNLVIENANIIGNAFVGALAGLAKNSTIEKVGVRNSSLRVEDSFDGYVGGLIGYALADYSSSTDAMIIRQCFADNVVVSAPNTDYPFAGGLIGYFKVLVGAGIIENCYAIGTVNFGSKDSLKIGGLIGELEIYAREVRVVDCYAAVAPGIIGASYWKGFIGGYLYDFIIIGANNYFDKDVARVTIGSTNGRLQTGKETSEMKRQATFKGWDFENIWTINEGNDYPRLKWEF